MQTIATNKKANHNYLIKAKFEAGLVLTGAEVKSLRVNTGSIKELIMETLKKMIKMAIWVAFGPF